MGWGGWGGYILYIIWYLYILVYIAIYYAGWGGVGWDYIYIYIYIHICATGSKHRYDASRAHFRKLGWGGVGCLRSTLWTMAEVVDATRSSLAGWGVGGTVMLRYMWSCTCTSCYATRSSLGHYHATLQDLELALHATLQDLHLHFMLSLHVSIHLHFMLRYKIYHYALSCYATRSSLALHATLHVLHLHFMLRYARSSLALHATTPNDLHLSLHATLHDLQLHFMATLHESLPTLIQVRTLVYEQWYGMVHESSWRWKVIGQIRDLSIGTFSPKLKRSWLSPAGELQKN